MGFEMKKAIVIGSGAGGAAAAKELQGKFEIKVIEEGNIIPYLEVRYLP